MSGGMYSNEEPPNLPREDASTLAVQQVDPSVAPHGPCFGCGATILERYFLLVSNRCWHTDCLKCCLCHVKLDQQSSCFIKDSMVFCREDYFRQFSKRCTRCHRPLSPSDLVMRARDSIYHVQCFTCQICASTLLPGEHFALGDNGVLYCQGHYEPLLAMAAGHADDAATVDELAAKRHKRRFKKNRKLITSESSDHIHQPYSDGFASDSGSLHLSMGVGGRAKRMRTSFKHHQLRTMKAYFTLNHNPDAKDLKQLAQKTGLTKRVLQVWFQNARAKYRRSVHGGRDERLDKRPTSQRSAASAADAPRGGSAAAAALDDAYPPAASVSPPDDSHSLAEYFQADAGLL